MGKADKGRAAYCMLVFALRGAALSRPSRWRGRPTGSIYPVNMLVGAQSALLEKTPLH